jgi:hypothetical protein
MLIFRIFYAKITDYINVVYHMKCDVQYISIGNIHGRKHQYFVGCFILNRNTMFSNN